MNHQAETAMDKLIGLIRGVRNIRNEMNTPLSKKVPMQINVNDDATENIFTANKAYIVRFCNPETLEIGQNLETTEEAVTAIISGGEVRMPLAGLIKLEDEIVRLEGEAAKLEKEVDRVVKKLGNERFVSKAPDAVVEGERAKEKDYREKLATVNERIASLKAQL